MGNPDHKEHGLLLYLSPELQLALLKYQVNMEANRSIAGLNALTDGLHASGYLDEQTFQALKARYKRKIVRKVEPEVSPQAAREIASMTQLFSGVIDQWKYHKDGDWRAKWVKKAREYENRVPNARYIIALAEKGD